MTVAPTRPPGPGAGHRSSSVFRSDIQALRALAVGAVVAFHLWPDLLTGGYVGVDVFFVISGFLITGQLVREAESSGRIVLVDFYVRRIRRLLPASFLVLVATLLALVIATPMVAWSGNLVEIATAAAYAVNWHLAALQTSYLGAHATPSAVQHYWSLAVEEQFYLVWPLLLILVTRLGAARGARSTRTVAAGALGIVAIASFADCVVMMSSRPVSAFYLPQARAWEFALGGLVALGQPVLGHVSQPSLVRWTGVGLVVGSCLLLDQASAFPGWLALPPTVGAALVIASGPGSRLLAAPPLQWLGDRSYAVYLWHWPPIVLLPWVLHRGLDSSSRLGILTATLVAAAATKRWVEDLVRHASWSQRRLPALTFACAGAAGLVIASAVVVAHVDSVDRIEAAREAASIAADQPCFGAAAMVSDSCPGPFARPTDSAITYAATDRGPASSSCQLPPDGPVIPRWCTFGDDTASESTIAVVGNSYAVQLVPLLLQWSEHRSVRIQLAARTDCLGLSTSPVSGQDPTDPCVAWSARVQQQLLAMPDLTGVVFTAHESSLQYLTGRSDPSAAAVDEATAHVVDTLRELADRGVPVLVVKHAPGTRPVQAPECVARSRAAYDPCALDRGPVTTMDFLSNIAAANPDLDTFMSLDAYFCSGASCHATIGGLVAYFDDHHISATYARTLAPYVAPFLNRVLGGRGSSG